MDPAEKRAVACLAGRRIDLPRESDERFPLANAPAVYDALVATIQRVRIDHLFCSAACGADLLALEACERLNVGATIILPFSPDLFRPLSVMDRPGDWGPRFDRLVTSAREAGELVELGLSVDDADAFERTNVEIVNRTAREKAKFHYAIIVWEGASRGEGDVTRDLRDRAVGRGFLAVEVPTRNPA